MQLLAAKKVTIIVEKILQTQIQSKLLELGASGYTSFECSGSGDRGVRSEDTGIGTNLQFILICSEDVALKILKYVADHYFPKYAGIAWSTDVQVVKGSN